MRTKLTRTCRMAASGLMYTLLLAMLLFFYKADAQTWSAVGSGGMDDWVYATTVYNGDLIAAGKFNNAGGVSASHIARWDGNAWHPLGLGVNGKVWALIVHNGLLYVGGEFTQAGGIPMNYIAIWDGTQWLNDLGDMGSIVSCFAVYNNKLIAGGYFTDADGVPLNYVAQYGSNGWEALGTGTVGTQGQVMAMEVYNNELIVGGFFTSAGGVPANHVAKWNGTGWSALGSGISNIVYSFTNYNGNLIAGGLFLSAGGVPANHIASWNGSSWSPLGAGMSGTFYQYVFALTVYNNHLIAGGYFTHSDGIQTNGIAQWNDTAWSDMGCGLFYPGNVYGAHTFCLYDSSLIVGGLFYSAGCTSAGHLARYDATSTGCTLPDPVITALSNTSFCSGDSVSLIVSGSPGVTFEWSGGITDTILTAYHSGTYSVTITDPSSCTASAFETVTENIVTATITASPGEVLSCWADSVVLSASSAGMSYNWSNGFADSATTVVAPGIYSVTLTEAVSGCSASASVLITSLPLPLVYLGNDTSICSSCILLLNAGAGFAHYNWSNGDTTAITGIHTSGLYTVQVTDTNGCSAYDTISVLVTPLGILNNYQAGEDISIYKNSGTNTFFIHGSEDVSAAEGYIYNLAGEAVHSFRYTGGTQELDLPALVPAVYILEIRTRARLYRFKLTVN